MSSEIFVLILVTDYVLSASQMTGLGLRNAIDARSTTINALLV